MVLILTDWEAEVDAADRFGRTASHIAAKNEDSEASAVLKAMATCRAFKKRNCFYLFRVTGIRYLKP